MIKNFNKIAGKANFYDYEDQLNYFDYFGINEEDLKNIFKVFKTNEKNPEFLLQQLAKKLEEKIVFYINHVYINNQLHELKLKKDIIANKAFLIGILYTASRLLAQEFVLLSTANRVTFKVDLKVFKFASERFNYHIYKNSLKKYYESILMWIAPLLENNSETIEVFANLDNLIENKVYNLKLYKDLFIYIWMHSYIKEFCEIKDYFEKINEDKDFKLEFQYNVLKPIDYNSLFKSDNLIEDKKRNSIVEDFYQWKDEKINSSISEIKEKIFKKIKIFESINLSQYFQILENIKSSFSICDSYELKTYIDSLYETIIKNVDQNINKADLFALIEKLFTYKNKNFKNNDEYISRLYKHPIFSFVNYDHNRYLTAYPEFLWLSENFTKEFNLFEEEIMEKFSSEMDYHLHDFAIETLKVISKKYSSIIVYDAKDITFFWNQAKEEVRNLKVNAVIYEKRLEKTFFIINNFYPESLENWITTKRTIDATCNFNNLSQTIYNSKVISFEKEIQKIKKQLKIKQDNTDEFIILTNDILNMNPKVRVKDYTFYITDISLLDYFLNNFIYRK